MELRIIGKKVPRHDAWDKALGITRYAADFSMPGMLFGKVLRSRHSSARITSVDTSRAERLGGIRAVITAKDVPKNEFLIRYGQIHSMGRGIEGIYRVLADKKVHFMGEAVALIAAESEEIAERASGLIRVEYQPLPGVFDPLEAMQPNAPQVEEGRSNIIAHHEVVKGDVNKGFSEADIIVENTYRVPFVDHAYMELESGVAWIDENGVVTIRLATQDVGLFGAVADVLELPHNRVRIIGTYAGGGFGGKLDMTVESSLALLTYKTGRPVKLTYSREESILCHSKRHPFIMEYKTGVQKNGQLTALEAKLVSDAGAYVYLSPWVLITAMVNAAGPYRIPHVKVDGYTVLTNNTFTSANRGFGVPQVCFAYESQMNELAKCLEMDPLEIRKINYLAKGEPLSTGQVLESHVALKETTERALQALGDRRASTTGKMKIGRGIASGMMSYGRMVFLHDTSRAHVSIEMDGSVTVRTGVHDIGGGQASSLCQIAAEVFGVPLEDVKIYVSDSALTPSAGRASATRQLYMSGNATLVAAQEVRRTLLKKAGELMRIHPERLDLVDREVIDTEGSGESRTLAEVVKACAFAGLPLSHGSLFKAPFRDLPVYERIEGQIYPDFTFGSQAVEVAVDEETGRVQVLKVVSCYDVGKAINPLSVEGQMEGGAIYGMGYALTEEVILKKGETMTPTLSEYLLPTAMDVPDIQTILLESGEGLGPFGARGVGEPSVGSIAPAICNAIDDAIGVRVLDLPMTPEKIVRALKGKRL
ncbi:MAG: xanthine dehydrogenase family protein [Deltaproteobacteria bacterium]|nr:xanthine dehydrogenase family protein [Deltaproteobacteria bacterium]